MRCKFLCCFLVVGIWFFGLGIGFSSESKQEGFKYNSHNRKDPMIPVVDQTGKVLFQEGLSSGKKVLALKLQGIIFRESGRSKAIIEKKLYKVGDKVSGFLVKKIYPDHVILTDGKDNYELWLNLSDREK